MDGDDDTGVQELVVRFREQFLIDVQPEWLPPAWDVHHAAPRAFGEHSVFSRADDAAKSGDRCAP